MIFLINVIVSCGYLYFTRNIKKINFLYFLPIISLWTFILGFQYGVGTDYFNYLEIFNNVDRLNYYYYFKKEYIFFYFVKILRNFFENGQIFFILVSLIENILFYYYIKLMIINKIINRKRLYLYIFLFLCFGTNFYNQMNGIRQYFNIYLISICIFYIYYNNFFKYFFIYVIGANIHKSFLLFFPIYIFKYLYKKLNSTKLQILIVLAIGFNFLPVIEILKTIIGMIPNYSYYANHWYLREIDITQKITKFIFFPYYIYSAFLIRQKKKKIEIYMLKVTILAYVIRIFCLKLTVTNRMGEYFTLLSIYPIYLVIENYIQKKKKIELVILLSLILGLFLVKVIIFPKNEYLYNSYLFH